MFLKIKKKLLFKKYVIMLVGCEKMEYQYLLKQLLWLIPNDDWQSAILEEDELTDGNPYSTPDKTGVRHIDYFLHIFKKLGKNFLIKEMNFLLL